MSKGLIFLVVVGLSIEAVYAAPPCSNWTEKDFATDIKSDWMFELWKNGKMEKLNFQPILVEFRRMFPILQSSTKC